MCISLIKIRIFLFTIYAHLDLLTYFYQFLYLALFLYSFLSGFIFLLEEHPIIIPSMKVCTFMNGMSLSAFHFNYKLAGYKNLVGTLKL